MKNSLLWLLALLMITLVACEDDDSSVKTEEDSGPDRGYTTEVSADLTSGGHWTLEGSPYYVSVSDDSVLTIPAGQELIIDAGVNVYMAKWANIYVEGTLTAVGTLDSPIRFISSKADEDYGLWGSLVFRTYNPDDSLSQASWNADNSVMQYCFVGYGAKFNRDDFERSAQIVLNSASPTIEHCLVYYSQYNGVLLTGDSRPTLRSNIIHANDGSGLVFDANHIGNTVEIDWLTGNNGEPYISNNNVSSNSSLQFRMPEVGFQTTQFGYTATIILPDSTTQDTVLVNSTLLFGSTRLGYDEDGDVIYRRNESNDPCDQFSNTVADAYFDEINADVQIYNSCSPCIEAGFDYNGDKRTDLAMVYYEAAPNELRKRIKQTTLDGGVYTVTCDAFSHEAVSLSNLTVEFSDYFGLEFDNELSVTNVEFVPTADRTGLPAWKSVVFYNDSLEMHASFENCSFYGGSESSNTGDNFVLNGGMLEIRDGMNATVTHCDFSHGYNHGVSIEGTTGKLVVDNCSFEEIGYAAVYAYDGADLELINSTISSVGAYGVMVYDTDQGVRIENNLFLNPGTYGVKLWSNATDASVVLNNTITGATAGGMKLNDNCNPLIQGNIIASCDNPNSDVASAIHGQAVGESNDYNNPVVNLNVFYDNGEVTDDYFPANWAFVSECNSYDVDPELTGTEYLPAGGTAFDFGEGCATANVGWDPANPVSPEEN